MLISVLDFFIQPNLVLQTNLRVVAMITHFECRAKGPIENTTTLNALLISIRFREGERRE